MRWPWQETIYEDGVAYLTRYTLLWTPLLRLYLHRIHKSDAGRELHDHPWGFVSLILRGGYKEHLPGVNGIPHAVLHWKPMDIIFHRARDFHRVELFEDNGVEREATTLVLCGPKVKPWGFLTRAGWVEASEYLKRESCRPKN